MSSHETNSQSPADILNKAENDLNVYLEKIGDFGNLSMTVGGAAVIGLGQSDAFKDDPSTHQLLVFYTAVGLICYEIARGRQYQGNMSSILILLGNIGRMATLITSISSFLFHGYAPMAFELSLMIVGCSTVLPLHGYRATIRSRNNSLLKSTELLQNDNRLDSQNDLNQNGHESETAFTAWLKKSGDTGYGYIIAKGVAVLASGSSDTFKDHPDTAYYLFYYTAIGLISYEIAKGNEYKGFSQWLVLLGDVMRVAIVITGTLHFVVPQHEWVALSLSVVVVAVSSFTTFIEYKKKISLHHIQRTSHTSRV